MNIKKNYIGQHVTCYDKEEVKSIMEDQFSDVVAEIRQNVIDTIKTIPKIYQSDIECVLNNYSFDEIQKAVDEYNNRIYVGDVIEYMDSDIRMLVVDIHDGTYICLSGYNFEPVYIDSKDFSVHIDSEDVSLVRKIKDEHKSIELIADFIGKSIKTEESESDIPKDRYEEILTKLP